MADIKLFKLATNSVIELDGRAVALEKSLQDIFERHLEPLLGVRFLASEYRTSNRGRMDTLGIDENNCLIYLNRFQATHSIERKVRLAAIVVKSRLRAHLSTLTDR